MKSDDKLLLDYFFILGLTNENREKIMQDKLNNQPLYSSPEILSSYSIEEDQLFTFIKNNLSKNDDLRNNIFPMKTDYLDIIINPGFEDENIKGIKKVFSDYIIQTENNSPPEKFYHCFQYELSGFTSHDLVMNFGVLIFYEIICSKEFLEKENKNKDINIYSGKALVLISDKPVFSLMKKILEKIYLNFIKLKYSYIYLEPFIFNIFHSLKNNISNISFKNENKNIEEKKDIYYFPLKDSILPFCDLNIEYFLKIFDINDILLISEYYFLTKSIIFVSPNCELLYPIYHTLMTLFFPLNFHLKYYFYKLLTPDLVLSGISSPFSCFYFVYTDKNINKGYIEDNIIKRFTENKKEILVFQIIQSLDDETNCMKINIEKNLYVYDNEDKFSKISTETKKNNTLIENVILMFKNKYDYKEVIKNNIDLIHKQNLNLIFSDFFSFPRNLHSLDFIRKNFLGLIIKFLVINIKQLTIRLDEDGKLEICPLIIDEKFLNERNDKKNQDKNEQLKNFFESPQTELIYKNEIIKLNYLEIDFLKAQILLDYFIKISKNDPNTLYFDEANSKFKLEDIKEKKEDAETKELIEIEFEDLFDYNKYITSKIGKISKIKKKENNNDYEIISILELKNYLTINEDKLNFFLENNIDLVILFNENFRLNFDNFNSIFNAFLLFGQNTTYYYNKNDPIIRNNNYDKNNQDKNKYYYLILYEAKIFKKIFYTINTVNRKELASCAIGLYISLYLIKLLSKKKIKKKKKKI